MMELSDQQARDLGTLLHDMAVWMTRAELSMTKEQKQLWMNFVTEGRQLREWATRDAVRVLKFQFPSSVA